MRRILCSHIRARIQSEWSPKMSFPPPESAWTPTKAMNQPAACDEFAENIKIAFDSMTKDSVTTSDKTNWSIAHTHFTSRTKRWWKTKHIHLHRIRIARHESIGKCYSDSDRLNSYRRHHSEQSKPRPRQWQNRSYIWKRKFGCDFSIRFGAIAIALVRTSSILQWMDACSNIYLYFSLICVCACARVRLWELILAVEAVSKKKHTHTM